MTLFFAIFGSLGLFLYGMKVMSEGLQKVSGEGLRALIRNMTRNRVSGIVSGTLMTTLVQSSSATTVMIVSFVNARLLTLRESIGMIMGANLGTTTTFWIVAFLGFKFSLNSIALPCVGIGVAMIFFKRPKIRDTGEALIGFGILFLGLSFLKGSVPDVKSNPEIFSFLADWTGHGMGSVGIFFLFGVILTVVVQSSSVAGAITLTLVAKGWIGYEDAAAIVLGENVGTTITANLAAMTGGIEAKRAARAHFLFNIVGVIWMLAVFYPFVQGIEWLTNQSIHWLTPGEATPTGDNTLYKLALFHSMFNLTNILVQTPFVKQLALLATKMVKEKKATSETVEHINYQAPNLPQTGEINLAEAEREIKGMAELTREMFSGFNEVYENPDKDLSVRVKELKAMEEQSDRLAFDITQYLIYCTSSELSRERLNEVTVMLRVVSELEEICDCAYNLVRLAQQKYNKQRVLPAETQEAIRNFSGPVDQFMSFYIESLNRKVSMADMEVAQQLEDTIDASRKKLRKEAVRRMSDPTNIKSEMLYIDILNNIESIGDKSLNILKLLSQID
ncbi:MULTISPECIES: Na/Pi cotransporter family protein [unclassified Lentimonas]|uniref:Na/Pi cotransporter family protein n=1 Tax=unclassified Lentimonas TaxID=2630993 RepID=UPI001325BF8A|nr:MULTISPECIES: Na/Pi cotransporter family protein [unclassified Lentimonas]CAA6678213.1 Sodium-dependent phosphate transporter [Lentimonas sp. CC4]CAA6686602.1 Sodium-dependent phosphate transporter [Lentimonas sp. CC6]CAA7074878.1 Sodium-dependent phosphate transporter [Lentimonas sp. CC4]CAA7169504.1 Sodium-dependent phosphate transporter [Lentimonas sp. CC21]CAA7179777.1 Sodium-dependent phosphate transporter [Lentimonas sp. CC8]